MEVLAPQKLSAGLITAKPQTKIHALTSSIFDHNATRKNMPNLNACTAMSTQSFEINNRSDTHTNKLDHTNHTRCNDTKLGALPLGEGGGAKHSPLTGAHGKMWQKSSKSTFLKIISDHPRDLRNTPGHK